MYQYKWVQTECRLKFSQCKKTEFIVFNELCWSRGAQKLTFMKRQPDVRSMFSQNNFYLLYRSACKNKKSWLEKKISSHPIPRMLTSCVNILSHRVEGGMGGCTPQSPQEPLQPRGLLHQCTERARSWGACWGSNPGDPINPLPLPTMMAAVVADTKIALWCRCFWCVSSFWHVLICHATETFSLYRVRANCPSIWATLG